MRVRRIRQALVLVDGEKGKHLLTARFGIEQGHLRHRQHQTGIRAIARRWTDLATMAMRLC